MNDITLYDTLFPDSDDIDSQMDPGLMAINEMFSHLNFPEISKVYDLKLYNEIFSNRNPELLSVMHFNIRCALANKTQLEAVLSTLSTQPDVIALSETWLTEHDKDLFFLDGYQAFHVVRQHSIHGGVSVLIREGLNADIQTDFSFVDLEIEICTVSINILEVTYTVACVYRPRFKTEKIKEFRQKLARILKSKQFNKSKTIILGDFNIDLLAHTHHLETNNFLNLMQVYNYLPTITRPTRFPEGQQQGSPALLDHIYINFYPPAISGIIHYNLTDHLPVFMNMLIPKISTKLKRVQFRLFNDTNKAQFSRELALIDFDSLISPSNDLNTNFNLFFDKLSDAYNKNFPIKTKTLTTKRIDNKWLTSGLLTSIKNKNHLFKQYRLNLVSEARYKTFRNRLTSLIRISKKGLLQQPIF